MQEEKLKKREEFSQALIAARIKARMSQPELAKALGVTNGAVGGWETGRNLPRMKQADALKRVLGLDCENLHQEDSHESYISTPSNGRIAQPEKGLRMIPVISHARAGHGALDDLTSNYDDIEAQIDEHIESDCKDPNAFALIVEGDSMEPRFLAGDRVIFAPNETPRTGDFVVARIYETGQVLFKKFRQTGRNGESVLLESLNPAYDTIELARSVFRFIFPAVDLKSKLRR